MISILIDPFLRSDHYLFEFVNRSRITTGAPKIEVTELILSSTGAKRVLAIRSLKRQKIAPPKKHEDMVTGGSSVLKIFLIR